MNQPVSPTPVAPAVAAAPSGIALAGELLLKEINTPEARAVLVKLIEAVEAAVESQTKNPFLKQMELTGFSLVKGYLASLPTS